MAIINCKTCGGSVELSEDKTFGTCECCGNTMTFPKVSDEQRAAAFNRGNHFRRIGEFDKALAVYERIVREEEENAEAHWCCALCRFGIEYVEDPATFEWLPTCHRASFDSFLEDVDYKAALEYSDGITRRQYMKDAAKIAEVQRSILATSQSTEPFDVFLCYKETDDSGERTRDSLLAQEIYYELTEQGRKVFFARITLEDVAGTQYEPYIFAALNSAKVMVVVGTRPEYLNAVWVKNEWSRFLAMMKKDRTKLLLPCYRDMDPYDLPDQLSVLQSYDMGKIGFLQDLTRGIAKVLDAERKPSRSETVVVQQASGNISALLKRGFMALEDREWTSADEFFEDVLNQDAECADAYIGKTLAFMQMPTLAALVEDKIRDTAQAEEQTLSIPKAREHIEQMAAKYAVPGYLEPRELTKLYDFGLTYQSALADRQDQKGDLHQFWTGHRQLSRAIRFAQGDTKKLLEDAHGQLMAAADQRIQLAEKTAQERKAALEESYAAHIAAADQKAEAMNAKARERRENDYQAAIQNMEASKTGDQFRNAAKRFEMLGDYQDSRQYVKICREKADDWDYEQRRIAREKEAERRRREEAEAEERRLREIEEKARAAEEEERRIIAARRKEREEKERRKKITLLACAAVAAVVALVLLVSLVFIPNGKYNSAMKLLESGSYQEAASIFEELEDHKDSPDKAEEAHYHLGVQAASDGDGRTALMHFDKAGDHADALSQAAAMRRQVADRKTFSSYSYSDNTLAVRSDGTVFAIGENEDGQCDVSGWTDIISVVMGYEFSMGLKSDGTVVTAGGYAADHMNECAKWTDIVGIWGYRNFVVGLKADGTVVCAGEAFSGQDDISDWTHIVDIAVGNQHTVGLKSDGTVVAVGINDNAVETKYGENYPCRVDDWTDIIDIDAGSHHTVGLRADGTVVGAGDNEDGQLKFSAWTDIAAVTAGGSYTIGLKHDGTAVAVGEFYYGKDENALVMSKIARWENIVAVNRTAALQADGILVGAADPMTVGWHDLIAIDTQSDITLGLKADGTVLGAYGDYTGMTGDESSWTDIVDIAAGDNFALGLKSDGTVVAVGENDYKKRDVGNWNNIIQIDAGDYHSVGLKADGTVVAAGADGEWVDEYQTHVSHWYNVIQISAGYQHTVGVTHDGVVWGSGNNEDGQLNITEWRDIAAASAGYYHTVGLKRDGTVVATGRNKDGQCKVSGWKNIIAVSAGNFHTLGLKADGTVVATGNNDNGECDVSSWRDIVAIAAGNGYSLGLRADGTVVAAGYLSNDSSHTVCFANVMLPGAAAPEGAPQETLSAQEKDYQEAKILLDRGQYQEAYDLFLSLGDYQDAEIYLSNFQYRMVRENDMEYVYNSLGQLAEIRDASGEPIYTYHYDEAGRLIQETRKSVQLTYTYNQDGFLETLEATGELQYSGSQAHRIAYYDDHGNMWKLEMLRTDNAQPMQVLIWEYVYDDNGYIQSFRFHEEGETEAKVYTLGDKNEHFFMVDNSYNPPTLYSWNDEGFETIYTYMKNGDTPVERTVHGRRWYDERGYILREDLEGANYVDSTFENTYDENGNLIYQKQTTSQGKVYEYNITYELIYVAPLGE